MWRVVTGTLIFLLLLVAALAMYLSVTASIADRASPYSYANNAMAALLFGVFGCLASAVATLLSWIAFGHWRLPSWKWLAALSTAAIATSASNLGWICLH